MLAKTRILSVSDYIALAIVAVIGIAGGLYVLRVSVITRFDGPIFTFVDGGFGYRWRSIFRLA